MKRIITVQDMIDELMLVVNKDAEINIVMNTGDYQTEYIPDLYDFSVIDFTDVHPDDGNSYEDDSFLMVYKLYDGVSVPRNNYPQWDKRLFRNKKSLIKYLSES